MNNYKTMITNNGKRLIIQNKELCIIMDKKSMKMNVWTR